MVSLGTQPANRKSGFGHSSPTGARAQDLSRQPARPDLWGAGVGNDHGLPDRWAPSSSRPCLSCCRRSCSAPRPCRRRSTRWGPGTRSSRDTPYCPRSSTWHSAPACSVGSTSSWPSGKCSVEPLRRAGHPRVVADCASLTSPCVARSSRLPDTPQAPARQAPACPGCPRVAPGRARRCGRPRDATPLHSCPLAARGESRSY